MTKIEYWQSVRLKLTGRTNSHPLEGREVVLNAEGLALYVHQYWKTNGVLPGDYMPIPGKERAYDYFQYLWLVARNEPTFIPTVLDIYEAHYLLSLRDVGDKWIHLRRVDAPGPFHDKLLAPQIQRIFQRALQDCEVLPHNEDSSTISALMFWCLEYTELKHAAKTLEWQDTFLQNVNILSLIFESPLSVSEIENVLGMFEHVRQKIRSLVGSTPQESMTNFNKDIRPILLGKLMCKANSFNAWERVFAHSLDRDAKIFALYHMSYRAKSLSQVVTQFRSASSIGLQPVAHSFREKWKGMCLEMGADELLRMSDHLNIDEAFIQSLILSKCDT